MPRFLNTSLAYGEMLRIVTTTRKELVLISPYIKIPPEFLERLKDVQKNINITIVCREEDLTNEQKDNLRQLDNLKLCFDKNLHAKCFYNEESMVIGSLNLYDHSVQNNHEMGILLNFYDDTKVFNEARNEAGYIVRQAEEVHLKKLPVLESVSLPRQSNHSKISEKKTTESSNSSILKDIGDFINKNLMQNGYCIRCGENIPQDVGKPYCKACYDKWSGWKNPEYEEGFCHSCGKKASTSMNKPQCRSCYRKS